MDAGSREERLGLLREATETIILLLGPFAPHVTEELWEQTGHRDSLFRHRWPEPDHAALAREEVLIVVQVDGKVRGRLTVETGARDERVREMALADGRIAPWLKARQVDRIVVVPDRLVNIVTRGA